MFLEKGKISQLQLIVLIIGFVYGSSVIVAPGGNAAGHDSWIGVSLGLMEGLAIAWIFTALARLFKNKTMVEINDLVYGRFLGKFVSALFIWYLFHLGALVLNNYTRFFKLEIYTATPRTIILLILMLVCASTVNRGIETLARCSLLLVPLTVLVVVMDTFLLIPHINLNNLLPVLDVPVTKIFVTAHGAASFPFAETVAFLMVAAALNKPEKGPSAVAWGLLAGGITLIFLTARNAAVLGSMAAAYNYPSYLAAQVIEVGEIFTRLEVLVAINLITMGFIKISVLFYGSAVGLAQVFKLHDYRPLILPIGILMVILALTNVGNTLEMIDFANKVYPIYAIPFQIGIPLITLIIAKLRKLPPKGETIS